MDAVGGWLLAGAQVSRVSQWEVPSDYVKDRTYVMKPATFGMSFYHT